MQDLNGLLHRLAHNYTLVAAAALLFFAGKAAAGYATWRHYNRKLSELERKLDRLLGGRSD